LLWEAFGTLILATFPPQINIPIHFERHQISKLHEPPAAALPKHSSVRSQLSRTKPLEGKIAEFGPKVGRCLRGYSREKRAMPNLELMDGGFNGRWWVFSMREGRAECELCGVIRFGTSRDV